MSFPANIDNGTSLPNPTQGSTLDNPDHAALHTNENAGIIALETKLGTGASTPTNNNLLVGTGTGTSAWSKASPAGAIVGTTDTQTLTNKVIDASQLVDASVTTAKLSTTNGEIAGAWLPWTPYINGCSSSSAVCSYLKIGKTVFFSFGVSGVSNASFFSLTLPVPPKRSERYVIRGYDNGVYKSNPCLALTDLSGPGYIVLYSTLLGEGWTPSGNKAVEQTTIVYEAA